MDRFRRHVHNSGLGGIYNSSVNGPYYSGHRTANPSIRSTSYQNTADGVDQTPDVTHSTGDRVDMNTVSKRKRKSSSQAGSVKRTRVIKKKKKITKAKNKTSGSSKKKAIIKPKTSRKLVDRF